jgi:hypothetical protein
LPTKNKSVDYYKARIDLMIIRGAEKESPQQRRTLQKLFDATLPPQ